MGAKWRTNRHKLGTCFTAQRLAGAIVSPLFTLPWFHIGHGMHWHYALCGLGLVIQEVLGNIFSEYLDKGACQVVPRRQCVKVCGAN